MATHAFYVTCAYAALALAVIVELFSLRRQRSRARRHVHEVHELAAAGDEATP